MKQTMKRSVRPLALLLMGGLLWTLSACGGGAGTESGEVETAPAEPAVAEVEAPPEDRPTTPEAVELETTEIGAAEEAPTAAELEALEKDLELRERELALKARELELKERELAQKRRESRPVVAAPEPSPAPKPSPEPVEERAEVSPQPSPGPAFEPEPEPAPQPVWLDVPAGREMQVEFLTPLSSATSREGDSFRTRVLEPVHAASGEVAIPAGSEVLGRVVESVTNDRRIGGRSRLVIEFTDLVLPSGTTVPVNASFAEESKSGKKKDAATIGGAAAAGAILGSILGDDEAAVVGAILGGAAGSVLASRNKGENVEISAGTPVRLRLDDTVAVRVYR